MPLRPSTIGSKCQKPIVNRLRSRFEREFSSADVTIRLETQRASMVMQASASEYAPSKAIEYEPDRRPKRIPKPATQTVTTIDIRKKPCSVIMLGKRPRDGCPGPGGTSFLRRIDAASPGRYHGATSRWPH